MRRYSSPKYTVFSFIPSSSATSLTRWPQPLPQSKSQNGVLIATASTSTPCSSIILTARQLSRPPHSNATAFGFFSSCFFSPSCCDIVVRLWATGYKNDTVYSSGQSAIANVGVRLLLADQQELQKVISLIKAAELGGATNLSSKGW